MHVEQRILRQRNTSQGIFTILPTEVANLPTEQAQGGVAPPPHTHTHTHFLVPGLLVQPNLDPMRQNRCQILI